MVFAGVGDEFDGDAVLPEGAVHLEGLAEGVSVIGLALEEEERGFGFGGGCQGTLPPGIGEASPGFAKVPAVVPTAVLCAVFAELVDDGSPRDDGAEAVGFADGETGHFAAVAVAHEGETGGVDGEGLDGFVKAGHDVAEVASAEVVFVGGSEFSAVAGGAAGVGAQDCPSVAEEEGCPWIVAVIPCAERAAVNIHDEGDLLGGGIRWKVEQALDREAIALPVDELGFGWGEMLRGERRGGEGFAGSVEAGGEAEGFRLIAGLGKPDKAGLLAIGGEIGDERRGRGELDEWGLAGGVELGQAEPRAFGDGSEDGAVGEIDRLAETEAAQEAGHETNGLGSGLSEVEGVEFFDARGSILRGLGGEE